MNKISRREAIGALAFLSVGLLPLRGDAQTRVAIVCNGDDATAAKDALILQSKLAGAMLRTGRFSLVDRDRLDRIIREQGFSNSAYADPHAAAALGKLVGAQQLLNIDLSSETNSDNGALLTTTEYHISATFTLVSTSTGSISSSGTADGDAQDKESAGSSSSTMALSAMRREAIDSCVDDLMQQLSN